MSTITTNTNHDDYRIALYYCYIPIDDVDECIARQESICSSLQLFGRIRISQEGINGVVSGLYTNLIEYTCQTTLQLNLKPNLQVKYSHLRQDLSVEAQLFETLSIQSTREVISLFDPTQPQPQQENKQDEHDDSQQSQQHETARRLDPHEWNAQLLSSENDSILVDARNVYESRVGHFEVEGIPTLLPNTRKYSDLPQVFQQFKEQLKDKDVYMFCTGGVRCEQASAYLKTLIPRTNIYQLEGGIVAYLQHYGSNSITAATPNKECLFQGKNFVFDLRRTDPCIGGNGMYGTCLVCGVPHDDYDNGHAPVERREARCVKCRVLVLCCDQCRSTRCLWGEEETKAHFPKLYCGGMSGCMDEIGSSQATII